MLTVPKRENLKMLWNLFSGSGTAIQPISTTNLQPAVTQTSYNAGLRDIGNSLSMLLENRKNTFGKEKLL